MMSSVSRMECRSAILPFFIVYIMLRLLVILNNVLGRVSPAAVGRVGELECISDKIDALSL